MKAMIFAAGYGTRLKPFTLHHPKALVPVVGVAMLQRVICHLKAQGVNEFVINVHHFAQQIVEFLHSNQDFGCTIHISDESHLLLDTGGGVLAARCWLEDGHEPFIVHNVDILTDLSISDMLKYHNANSGDALATLLVSHRQTSRYLLFDKEMRMRGWTNVNLGTVRPEGIEIEGLEKAAFGGIHIMSPKIFPLLEDYCKRLPDEQFSSIGIKPFSITDFYVDGCLRHIYKGYMAQDGLLWFDIGRQETLSKAEEAIVGQQA